MRIGDLKLQDGYCWKLVAILQNDEEIVFHWQELVQWFLQNNFVSVETGKDHQRASILFPEDEYPNSLRLREERFVKVAEVKEAKTT